MLGQTYSFIHHSHWRFVLKSGVNKAWFFPCLLLLFPTTLEKQVEVEEKEQEQTKLSKKISGKLKNRKIREQKVIIFPHFFRDLFFATGQWKAWNLSAVNPDIAINCIFVFHILWWQMWEKRDFYSNWMRKIMGINQFFFLWVCRYRNVSCIYTIISLYYSYNKVFWFACELQRI